MLEGVVDLAKPRFYLCLSCRFGDHAECRKGKCECECGSSIETASLPMRVMGVKRSKVVPASSATGTRQAGLSRSDPTVRRRRPLYTAAQLRLALEGRSAGQVSALDSLMGPDLSTLFSSGKARRTGQPYQGPVSTKIKVCGRGLCRGGLTTLSSCLALRLSQCS